MLLVLSTYSLAFIFFSIIKDELSMSLRKVKPAIKSHLFFLLKDLALEIVSPLSCIIQFFFPFYGKKFLQTHKVAVIDLILKTNPKRHCLVTFSSYCLYLPSLYRKSFLLEYLLFLHSYSSLRLLQSCLVSTMIFWQLSTRTLVMNALLNPMHIIFLSLLFLIIRSI